MRSTAERVKLEREYANCLHILDELAKLADPYRRYVNFQFPATSQPGEIWALHRYFKARALRAESELKHLGDRRDHRIAQLRETEHELLPIAQDVCRNAMQRFELRIIGLIQGFPELMAPTESTAALTPTRKSPSNQNQGACEIRELAPGVGLPLVDIRKPAGTIAKETGRAALKKGAPYRQVPELDRIVKAVEYRKTTGCTYAAASIKEFGSRNWADKIRYWDNKREHGEH
jgi:hypothetical protein